MPRVVTVVPTIGEVAPVPWISSIAMVPAGFTVILKVVVAVASVASLAVTVTLDTPAVVGVPVTSPVVLLIDSPAGRPVADHEYGAVPPVAVTVNGRDGLADGGALVGDGADARAARRDHVGGVLRVGSEPSRSLPSCRRCRRRRRCGSWQWRWPCPEPVPAPS